MFTTFVVHPIFNLLDVLYALLPGHNFGLALIIFTIIIRLLMWPLLKKQLHQSKAMRLLQPDIKRIKAATKGDRRQESLMLMELYKEKGITDTSKIPMKSLHLSGEAFDISDPKQELQKFIKANIKLMEEIGLWFEDFSVTTNSCRNTSLKRH